MKSNVGLLAPGFLFAVAVLVATDGDAVLREIGDGLEDCAETLVGGGGAGFEGLDLGLEGCGLLGDARWRRRRDLRSRAISSVSLLRWALRVSTWVMASRRSRSMAAKSPRAAAGSMPGRAVFLLLRAGWPGQMLSRSFGLYFSGFGGVARKSA